MEMTGKRVQNRKAPVPRFREDDDRNFKVIKITNSNRTNPPKDHILLGHLSPNRFLNNFNSRDARGIALIANNEENVENLDGTALLDSKTML